MYTTTYVRESKRLSYKRTRARKKDTYQIPKNLAGYIQAITQLHRAMEEYVQYPEQAKTNPTTQPIYIP